MCCGANFWLNTFNVYFRISDHISAVSNSYVVAVQYMKCHGGSLILAIIFNSKLPLIPGNVLYKSLRALSAKKNKNSSTRTIAEVSLPA